MAVIGSIAINMSTSTAAFAKGLADSRKQLGGFVSELGSAKSVFLGFAGALAGGAAVAGLKSLVKGSLDLIDSTGDAASRLGVTTEALSTFRYAVQLTGSETEGLEPSLLKLNKNLSEATSGAGPAADALKRLGMDAKTLIAAGPVEAAKMLSDGISKLGNQADKTSVVMDLFGKSGVGLLNSLGAGSGELAKLSEEAKSLGIGISSIDAAKAGAANDAFDRMGGVLQGLSNTLAIQLSPYIIAAGEGLVKFASQGIDAGALISKGLKGAISAIGMVADVIHTAKLGFELFQAGATMALSGIVKGLSYLGKGLESVLNLIPGVHVEFGTALDQIATDLDKLSSDQMAKFNASLLVEPPSTGIKTFFEGIATSAETAARAIAETQKATGGTSDALSTLGTKVNDLRDKLALQIKTFGLSSEQVEIYKLKLAGATDEQIKGLVAQNATLAGLEKQKELAGQKSEFKSAGALEIGSQEARSALLSYNGSKGDDGIKSVAKNTETSNKLLARLLAETVKGSGSKSAEVVSI